MPRGAAVLTGTRRTAAGRRDTSVSIQHLTESAGASHFPVETWVTQSPAVMMNRLDVRADERSTIGQMSAFLETMFQMPYMASMDPALVDVPKYRRLVVAGRIFDVRAASMIGRKRGIELLTIAGTRLPS